MIASKELSCASDLEISLERIIELGFGLGAEYGVPKGEIEFDS